MLKGIVTVDGQRRAMISRGDGHAQHELLAIGASALGITVVSIGTDTVVYSEAGRTVAATLRGPGEE